MAGTVKLRLNAKALLGEGPRWHAAQRRLYWVDILRNELHRFDPASGTDEVRQFDAPIGCFAFRAQGGLLLAMKDGFALIDTWDGPVRPFGTQILADRPDVRFNDGRTDPNGRFWAGTVNMSKSAEDAALYRLDPDGTLTEIQNGMTTCNGAAFSMDGTRFHHSDTPSHALRAYDADPTSGVLSNERILHQWPIGRGRPDGGSFDVEGGYWVAMFDGGRVVRLSPDGNIVEEVALPIRRPTMIALGGEDGRTAFVTTAQTGLSRWQRAVQRKAGGVFSFRVEVPGVPEWPFAG